MVFIDYKYLRVFLDNKLDWARNTEPIYEKGQSRLYLYVRIFHESVVATAIVCCGVLGQQMPTDATN